MSSISLAGVRAIILDIEGTTTPIDYVYGTLFAYVRSHLATYLEQGIAPEDLALLQQEYQQDTSPDKPLWAIPPDGYLLWLMDQDRKSRALKSIQGKIWQAGYEEGKLQGVLFDDVAPALATWQQQGLRIFIYSSGSVLAQKLLFAHTALGSLASYIEGYFDTEIGSKREVQSYQAIAFSIGLAPEHCLFISDSLPECQAASTAGFQVLHSVRPGNPPASSSFVQVSCFTEISGLQ